MFQSYLVRMKHGKSYNVRFGRMKVFNMDMVDLVVHCQNASSLKGLQRDKGISFLVF